MAGAGLLMLLVAAVLLLAEWRDYNQSLESGRNRVQTITDLVATQTETASLALDRTLRGSSQPLTLLARKWMDTRRSPRIG